MAVAWDASKTTKPYSAAFEKKYLQTAVNIGAKMIPFPLAIWVYDQSDATLKARAYRGFRPQDLKTISKILSNWRFFNGILRSDPQIVHVNPLTGYFLKRSIANDTVPKIVHAIRIMVNSKPAGILGILTGKGEIITNDMINSMGLLSGLAAKILEREHRIFEAKIFGDVVKELRATPDFNRLMNVIVRSAREFTQAYSSTVFLLDKVTDSFIIGARYPEHERDPKERPRSYSGLTRRIIEEGKPIRIDNTFSNPKVRNSVKRDGIRSLIGVRLQIGKERQGVLYVNGKRKHQFSEEDQRILQTMADQISVGLGWSRTLLSHLEDIEMASSNIFLLEDIFEKMANDIKSSLGFQYVSIQLVRAEEHTIESTYGTGIAKRWAGLAKHSLEQNQNLADLQADIYRTKNMEILSGQDKRLDPWIFKELQQENIARITTPIILGRDIYGGIKDNWWRDWKWEVTEDKVSICPTTKRIAQHSVLKLTHQKGKDSNIHKHELEVIGTVGAGYQNYRRKISPTKAKKVSQIIARYAPEIYKSQLSYVLETIVERAQQIVRADSATLHFLNDKVDGGYVYEVCSGQIHRNFLTKHPPREDGIGRKAIKEQNPIFIPDPRRPHPRDQLSKKNKKIYKDGIRAIAAFPIIVDDERKGVLYIHFHEFHRFTEDEIDWLQLFANHVVNAIRHTTMYTRARDSLHQLAALNSITNYLNQSSIDKNLLYRLSYQTLNLLAADVVTIYEYISSQDRFETPPEMAGRLVEQSEMYTEIGKNDAPNLLVESAEDVFSENVIDNRVLHNLNKRKNENRKTFVERENIKSAAGVKLYSGSEIVGVMFINYRRPHSFTPGDRQLIELLANAAGIAIKNRRMLTEINTLNEIDHEILNTSSFDDLLDRILEFIKKVTPSDRCEIRQFDPFTNELNVLTCNPNDGLVERASKILKKYEGITGWVAKKGISRMAKDTRKDPVYKVCDPRVRSELCVPLRDYDGETIGLINSESFNVGAFTQIDQMMLEAIASRVVAIIRNEERQRSLCALESIAVLGDLAGPLAHTLRNEMGGIKYFAKIIRSNINDNETVLENASDIIDCANRVLYWADKFTTWDVSDSEKQISIKDVILDTLARTKFPKGINKTTRIPNNMRRIRSGWDQLQLLFTNLVQNSIDAMPNGGKLTIKAKEFPLKKKPWVICWIEDNGVGISQDVLPYVCNSDYSTKDKERHMGFGLWWCKNYTERIGAKFKIKSKLGHGTTVEIKFPITNQ